MDTDMKTVTLPIAPRTVVKLKALSAAEPDAMAKALSPDQAIEFLRHVVSTGKELGAVVLAGPGEPLATPEQTLQVLGLIRQEFPETPVSLTTAGVLGDQDPVALGSLLSAAGLGSVTVQVDAVDPEIITGLYGWIRPGKKTIPMSRAATMLTGEQEKAVKGFLAAGLPVKVEVRVVPGVNDEHVDAVTETVKSWGVADVVWASPTESGAAGQLQDWQAQGGPVRPTAERPNVAVATSGGAQVDTHLGQARQLLIYGKRDDGLVSLLEAREAPAPGSGDDRWSALSETVRDCRVLLAAGAGQRPRQVLEEQGVHVMVTDGDVESVVDTLYGGGKKGKKKR